MEVEGGVTFALAGGKWYITAAAEKKLREKEKTKRTQAADDNTQKGEKFKEENKGGHRGVSQTSLTLTWTKLKGGKKRGENPWI